jgi:L-lactate permease
MVAFVAVLPLLTTFVLLGGLRWSPLAASVCSLIVATVVALRHTFERYHQLRHLLRNF